MAELVITETGPMFTIRSAAAYVMMVSYYNVGKSCQCDGCWKRMTTLLMLWMIKSV